MGDMIVKYEDEDWAYEDEDWDDLTTIIVYKKENPDDYPIALLLEEALNTLLGEGYKLKKIFQVYTPSSGQTTRTAEMSLQCEPCGPDLTLYEQRRP